MSAANGEKKIVIVPIADMRVSTRGDSLVTFALGSCLGITVWDPVEKAGGMLHAMLPDSRVDTVAATKKPNTFVDLGVPSLFRACYAAGVQKERAVVVVAGGATMRDTENERLQIGKRNMVILRKLLWKNGVLIAAEDVGGSSISRTMSIDIATGEISIKTDSGETTLWQVS